MTDNFLQIIPFAWASCLIHSMMADFLAVVGAPGVAGKGIATANSV